MLMEKAGRSADAVTWLQGLAAEGHGVPLREAIALLTKAERTGEAITWLHGLAAKGHTLAQSEAIALLTDVEGADDVITSLQLRAEKVGTAVFWQAASLLLSAGRTAEALACYRQAAAAGDTEALLKALALQKESDRRR
jgi:hypothetical protein